MPTRGVPTTEPTYARLIRGELCVWSPKQTIANHKICAGPDHVDGRGLTICGDHAPLADITAQDCLIQGDGDDALSVSGDCRRIKIRRVHVMGARQWPDPLDFRFVNKCCLFEGRAMYPDWLTVTDSSFDGGFRCPAIEGGVFRIERCWFGPSRRNELVNAVGDFIDTEFVVQVGMRVKDGDNPWADSMDKFVRPLCCKGDCRLYFKGCVLTVLDAAGQIIRSGPATGPELCRLRTQENMVGLDPDAPATMFVAKPNRR